MLAVSDHVVIAAPATARTRQLIDAAAFAAMKPGVHLVNVARGTLVDQEALLRRARRRPSGAGELDVVDPEPLPDGHWLYSHPGVRLSPHISWSSPDTMPRTIGMFVENLDGTGPVRRRPVGRLGRPVLSWRLMGSGRPGAVLGDARPRRTPSPSGCEAAVGRRLRRRVAVGARLRRGSRGRATPTPTCVSMLDDHGLAVAELDPAWWWLPGRRRSIDPAEFDTEDVFRFGESELFAIG